MEKRKFYLKDPMAELGISVRVPEEINPKEVIKDNDPRLKHLCYDESERERIKSILEEYQDKIKENNELIIALYKMNKRMWLLKETINQMITECDVNQLVLVINEYHHIKENYEKGVNYLNQKDRLHRLSLLLDFNFDPDHLFKPLDAPLCFDKSE